MIHIFTWIIFLTLALLLSSSWKSSSSTLMKQCLNNRSKYIYNKHMNLYSIKINDDVDSNNNDNYGGDDDVEFTRSALVRIIDDSWNKVTSLVPSSTLKMCERELKDATSLLVLATLRLLAYHYHYHIISYHILSYHTI